MASSRKVTIAVDEKFFNDIFENQRIQLQKKLGVINLSQANFTKMITGIRIRTPKKIRSKINRGGTNNDFFKI